MVRDASMGQPLAGGNRSCCPEIRFSAHCGGAVEEADEAGGRLARPPTGLVAGQDAETVPRLDRQQVAAPPSGAPPSGAPPSGALRSDCAVTGWCQCIAIENGEVSTRLKRQRAAAKRATDLLATRHSASPPASASTARPAVME